MPSELLWIHQYRASFSGERMIYWFWYVLLPAEWEEKSMDLVILLFCKTWKNYSVKIIWLPFLLWINDKRLLSCFNFQKQNKNNLRTGILVREYSRQIIFTFIILEHWKVCQDITQCKEIQRWCPRFQTKGKKDVKLNFQLSFFFEITHILWNNLFKHIKNYFI